MEWISTKDEAPEFFRRVWAYSREYDPASAHVMYLHPHLGWIDPEFGEGDPVESEITHWMPLPEPPKP